MRYGRALLLHALFALHPLHVESVAWVSERKDVLSTFFWMITMISYTWYVERRTVGRYLAIVADLLCLRPYVKTNAGDIAVCASPPGFLAAKKRRAWLSWKYNAPHLYPLPGHWESEIARVPEVILQKIPLFLLAGAASILTVSARKGSGAISTLDMIPLYIRLENASISCIAYIGKMVWPTQFAVFYPYPKVFSLPFVIGSLLLLGFVTLLVLIYRKRLPYLLVGWFWYLGTLVPVIGIVQVGSQAMADRYTYIPLLGFSSLLLGD